MAETHPDNDTPPLNPEQLRDIYYWMLLTRAVDDRCHTLFKQGQLPGSTFSSFGHEAIAVTAAYALEKDDACAPMHRDLGAYLLRGITPGRVFAQHMGRMGSPANGRDLNTHGLGDVNYNIYGYVSHLPQSMPVALGAAMAFQYRNEPRVAMTWTGDGSSSQGGWHETLNLAAVFKAPAVFLVENNQYAYSTPTRHQFAIEDLAIRAEGYGMPSEIVDGNDVFEVWNASKRAVDRARRGDGPTLIECKTMRIRGHAIHDSADYVPKDLIEEWLAKDPIPRLKVHLVERGELDEARDRAILDRIAGEVEAGVAWAEAQPKPDPGTLEDGVFA